jgi:type II secretory pathway component PulF
MKLAYSGYDKSGAPVSDVLDAGSTDEAVEVLRRKGIFVSQISEATKASGAGVPGAAAARRLGFGSGGRLEALSSLLRQLSILVRTGTPLMEALQAMERQLAPGPWRDVVGDLRHRVEEGSQLSEALARHPGYFDPVCRSLVAAGECGGKLDAMLDRLAVLTRKQVKIRKAVGGAMIYPALLSVVAVFVTVTMIGFVMPRFEELFKSLDTPLPPLTSFLMSLGMWLRGNWILALGSVLSGVGLGWFWIERGGGRLVVQQAMLSVPKVGTLVKSLATARLARVLGVLLESRVTLVDALALARESAGHPSFNAMVARAEEAVTRGESVAGTLADPTLIDPSICEAIRSGERTGQLGPVLLTVADHLDEDNEILVKTMTSLLEPLILLTMGVIVGIVAVSMFIPLFDLTAAGPHAGPGGPP